MSILNFNDGEKLAEESIKELVDSERSNRIYVSLEDYRNRGRTITKDFIEGFVSKINEKNSNNEIDEANRQVFLSIKDKIHIIGVLIIKKISGRFFEFSYDITREEERRLEYLERERYEKFMETFYDERTIYWY